MTPEGWRMVELRDILMPISRLQPVVAERTYPLLGVRWYGNGCHHHQTSQGSELKTSTLNTVLVGDVTYNKMWVSKGAFAVVGDNHNGLFATSEYPTFRTVANVLPAFILWAFKDPAFVALARESCRGTTSRARLNPRDFLRLPLILPSFGEQRKIAAILSSVDGAIEATQAVIDQLQIVKNAMMDKLLTRGLPGRHTKFKMTEVGEVPEEWEVELLDHVARRGSGHTPSKSHPEYWDGAIKWVSLQDSKKLDRLYIHDTAAKISASGIANSSATEHPAGTVVLSRDAGVGKSAITTDVMAVSQHFMAWLVFGGASSGRASRAAASSGIESARGASTLTRSR